MPECRYCDRSFSEEAAIREHLYSEHERGELSRIDGKRVDHYIDEEGLEEPDAEENARLIDEQTVDTTPFGDSDRDSVLSHGRWERHEVRELSTEQILANLEELGIQTTEAQFRERAAAVDSSRALTGAWVDHFEVEAYGYDEDFIWMAAHVLWERWAPAIPNSERIHELIDDGRDLLEDGKRVEACQRWLTAWEFTRAVTPDDITALNETEDHLPAVYSLETTLRDLESELATAAETESERHEQRIEFCRDVLERFPDSSRELRLDFRHAIADALADLGREADSRAELHAIIEAYSDDPWAYFKLGDSYSDDDPGAATGTDLERAADLYQHALERDIEQPSVVSERLDEVQRQLSSAGNHEDE